MTADEPQPVGFLSRYGFEEGYIRVYECAVCLCLTADLPGHRKHMEHGR